MFRRADELNEDPLHGFLVGLKMLSEMMADLPSGHPGCLVASYCYQDRLFDRNVRDLNAAAVLGWRTRFRERLELISARYPPRIAIDLDDLADMLSVIADGGIHSIQDREGQGRVAASGHAVPGSCAHRVSRRLTVSGLDLAWRLPVPFVAGGRDEGGDEFRSRLRLLSLTQTAPPPSRFLQHSTVPFSSHFTLPPLRMHSRTMLSVNPLCISALVHLCGFCLGADRCENKKK